MSTLETKLNELGFTAEDLDSIVDDAASRVASRINNEGLAKQIRFLEYQAGMSEHAILTALQEKQ